MARGKAINVKVATTKVIKALQDALDKMNKQFDAEEKAQKVDRKSTRLNSSHSQQSRMPSSA